MQQKNMNDITHQALFRRPLVQDGPAIYELIKNSPPLDLNSRYCYLILCEHFGSTCVVAETDGVISGFISAYVKPDDPATLFVWQVAVHESARGRGLASAMLESLLRRPGLNGVALIETTVTPGNIASETFFRAFARKKECRCLAEPLFGPSLFGGEGHEEERLFKIGPFKPA